MAADKIAAFYEDADRLAYHRRALAKAYDLRSLCIDSSPRWALARMLRFAVRSARGLLSAATARGTTAPPIDRRTPTVRHV
jgi:hypothetical protein